MRYRTIIALALAASPATGIIMDGETVPPPAEDAYEAGPLPLPGEPRGQGVDLRPLDDTDVEMRALVVRYYETVPCGGSAVPSGVCEEAAAILRGGGDRLARYLERQIEMNEIERWPNQGTYIDVIGRTEAPAAVAYLRARAARLAEDYATHGGDPHRLLWTIEALADTASPEAADAAMAALDRVAARDPGGYVTGEVASRTARAARDTRARHGAASIAHLRPRLERMIAEGEEYRSGDRGWEWAVTHARRALEQP